MKLNKIIFAIFIAVFMIFISFFSNCVFSKYVIDSQNLVAKINIDRCLPEIQLINIENSNRNYESYANKNHVITLKFKVTEKNILINNFTSNYIKFMLNETFISPSSVKINLLSHINDEMIYTITLSGISGNGILKIYFPEGIIEDQSNQKSKEDIFNTNIKIDNVSPVTIFKESLLSNGKSLARISCNETIRPINGWSISTNSLELSKEFSNIIYYPITITDFAQNSSIAYVDIKNADFIKLNYGIFYDSNKLDLVSASDISGKSIILSNSIHKVETLLINYENSSNPYLLQGKAFVYTHWGNGARAVCKYSENRYYHGYNPTETEWRDNSSNITCRINKINYLQFGGCGLNYKNATATNVKNPIPENIASQYLYGISAVAFSLKDYSEYSVVYQAYVKDVGWLACASDGQELFYAYAKPISAFRMNLVPKSEKQYLINFWNKDIGTNNI